MTTSNSAAEIDLETTASAFAHRVLLAVPVSRTIPIFGLQADAGRPDSELWSVSSSDGSGQLDKQAAGRIRAGYFGDHRFITTRHRTGLREVRYAFWLAFKKEESAEAFLTAFPRYGLFNLMADAQRRIATIEHDLRQGLMKGRYNLGDLDESLRYHRAKLYVTASRELRRLARYTSALGSLGQLP